MYLESDVNLFECILKDFDAAGILQDLILIGSWVLRVYAQYYGDDPQIPIISTTDIDFLVPNPPKISRKTNIPEILSKYDLEPMVFVLSIFTKLTPMSPQN